MLLYIAVCEGVSFGVCNPKETPLLAWGEYLFRVREFFFMFVGKWWGGADSGWRYDGQWKDGVANGQGTKWKPNGSVYLKGHFTGPNTVS